MAVPTYDLYGQDQRDRPDYWLHCETIASRSSRNRWEIRLHRHERFQQFLYIRGGACDATLGKERVQVQVPGVVVVPPGVEHGFRFSSDIDGIVVTVAVERAAGPTESVDAHWMSEPALIALATSGDRDFLDETIRRLLSAYESEGAASALSAAYLECALQLLKRQAQPRRASSLTQGATRRIDMLLALINEHKRSPLTVHELAARLKVSAGHLNRLARQVLGCSVHELIGQRLTEDAQRALLFSTNSIQDISEQLGFSDSAYFCRWFKKRRAMTPRQYRERMRRELARWPDDASASR